MEVFICAVLAGLMRGVNYGKQRNYLAFSDSRYYLDFRAPWMGWLASFGWSQ